MPVLRTFIAVDIPAAVRQAIQQQVAILRKEPGAALIRWVDGHGIHLTLKFLGDTSPTAVTDLTRNLPVEVERLPAFNLHVTGFGSFPSLKMPRVLWAGIQASAELEALNRAVEAVCRQLGYAPESHPFRPHLTIGRVRQGVSARDLQKIRQMLEAVTIDSLGTARVDSVHLYKSDLQSSGAVYTKLHTFLLQR